MLVVACYGAMGMPKAHLAHLCVLKKFISLGDRFYCCVTCGTCCCAAEPSVEVSHVRVCSTEKVYAFSYIETSSSVGDQVHCCCSCTMVFSCHTVIIEVASLVQHTADPSGCRFYAYHTLIVSIASPHPSS
jgi:hypothetical protein